MADDPWAQFNPQPAPEGPVTLGAPSPKYPYEGPQAAASLAGTHASTARTVQQTQQAATAFPTQQREAAANAAMAETKLGEEQQKQADAVRQQYLSKFMALQQNDNTLRAIREARGELNAFSAGPIGALTEEIPGLPAYSLGSDLATVKGNIAFKGYRDLKESMPQGAQGGIRLTDQELKLLSSLQGNLRQGLPPSKLRAHLDAIEQNYLRDSATAAGLDPNDPVVQQRLGITPEMPIHPQHLQASPQQARALIEQQRQNVAQRVANLPKAAQDIGWTSFWSDPGIRELNAIANGQDSSGGNPNIVSVERLP